VDLIQQGIDFILHVDEYLQQIITQYGVWTLGILFVIIFIETGLVIMPFLPGDSLIFAAGTFAAQGALNPLAIFVTLSIAAVAGDTVNYWIGNRVGSRAYTGEVKWLKKEHMERTHKFFEKHGGRTIFLARFVPIVRTFAPFVAGAGKMPYGFFIRWNVIGGIIWVGLFTALGYFFGNIPFVQRHFELVIVAIIGISLVPAVLEFVRARRHVAAEPEGA
jgi:membrane-associated protein